MKMLRTVMFFLFVTVHELFGSIVINQGGEGKHCTVQDKYQLEFFICSHQNLSYIPKTGNKVQGLLFEYNDLANVTKETFDNISNPDNMIEILINDNKIRNISSNALDEFTNLKRIILSFNPIFYDNLKLFLGALCKLKHLSHLDLSGIWSVKIQSDLFSLMNKNRIEVLEVRYYSMKEVSIDTFRGFNSLKTLILKDNRIEKLTLFKHKYLQSLHINNNRFTTFPDFSINGNESDCYFPCLEVIDIRSNIIQELGPESFKCLRKLRYMKFGDNPIETLPNNLLAKLPNLRSLSVKNLYGGLLRVQPFAFNSTSLTSLTIKLEGPAEGIFESLNDTFKFLPRLELLHITHISMLYLTSQQKAGLFSPLTKLRTFECYSCRFKDPKDIVSYMKDATSIYLHCNKITSINEETFKENKHLRYLNLSLNEIGYIAESAPLTSVLNGLSKLDLSDNPFVCDCNLEWFITWMKTNQKKLSGYPHKYICSKPMVKHNVQISDINFTYKECHPWSPWIWVAVIASPCVAVLGILVLILYKNRWNIKHHIYLLRNRRNYQRIPGDSYKYDAFVAYEATNSVWVREILLPVLEDDVGLKLCIHERDFQAGAFINDNIVSNIDASEKIIVVLTNAFAQSGWCMFELKVAHSKLIENETELVVILLEKLDARNMNHSLKVLLATTTYIEWTEDRVGQELFWAKLKDVLKN